MALINGTPKDDVLEGTPFKDSIFGLAGNDILRGLAGDDSLDGGSGNDLLNGGGGKDSLVGGKGDDTYIVNNTGDVVTEAVNSGIDTIKSSVSYALGSNLENLTLTGTGKINGTGNSLKNTIIGNIANNTIKGLAGNDTLYGDPLTAISENDAGDDILYGGDGNDTLYGDPVDLPPSSGLTGGDDILYGGNGNDTLTGGSIYNFASAGNNILYGGDGNDTLSAGVYGTSKLYGGNGDDSLRGGYEGTYILYGGDGDDSLQAGNAFGGFGNNTLYGGDGDDTLKGSNGGSNTNNTNVLYGGDGNDVLEAAFSNFNSYGSISTLYGNDGNDTLKTNVLEGTDTLTGGSGTDQFVFSSDEPFRTNNKSDYLEDVFEVDIITDFSGANATGGDVIVLDKTTFTTLTSPAGGPLLAAEFASVANDSLAGDVSDDIVFSRATGNLFYNQNGTATGFGTGDQFATLTGVGNLAAMDFLIQG